MVSVLGPNRQATPAFSSVSSGLMPAAVQQIQHFIQNFLPRVEPVGKWIVWD